jgi:hypothetical protein
LSRERTAQKKIPRRPAATPPARKAAPDEPAGPDQAADEFLAPPLHGKTDPPAEMADATPALDDDVRRYHHHPSETGAIEFSVDPDAGDAAADLAGDFGSQFLEGATRCEDLGSCAMEDEDREEGGGELLLEESPPDAEAPPSDAVRHRRTKRAGTR